MWKQKEESQKQIIWREHYTIAFWTAKYQIIGRYHKKEEWYLKKSVWLQKSETINCILHRKLDKL